MSELRKKIHDDNNGLDYVLVGDYYLPVLSLPGRNQTDWLLGDATEGISERT